MSQPSSLIGSPKSNSITGGNETVVTTPIVQEQPVEDVQATSNDPDSSANSLPASLDLLSPSPEFKRPEQPKRITRSNSAASFEMDKENTPPSISPESSSSSSTRPSTSSTSPVPSSPATPRRPIHQSFYQSPRRSPRLIKDHLSPRMGLPAQPTRAPTTTLTRIRHTHPYPPSHSIGNLKHSLSMFLEMKPFNMRRPDTLTPERDFRERGRKYFLMNY